MNRLKTTTGFTLIELLISILVLAVGLLGLAGLQAKGLKNNLTAYHRSQATQLAYDLADRMRANAVETETLGASSYITVTPANASVQSSCSTVANICSTAQMAQQDLFEWNRDLTAVLPNAEGTVSVSGSLFTVAIQWDGDRDGSRDDDPVFSMSFQL
ncbi:MAG: type IV pilus modification protein PilV [Methylococcales bacterium]|nr:type IV pilus modification protein PilV [Methylococcales bacterium]